ncbi:YihY/virulence factor BrkB family protein [Rubritalea marina]|uniref:YihY/virulence factor BrkB family protein n=1 Tax=Rubritalea marina TaxID=361055 RepID=UPI00036BBE70|nr:YihY/virulence factor BrkB family protein [Rubritalea marina]
MDGSISVMKLWGHRFYIAGLRWWSSRHANEAAALAFYSLFSLIPILVIVLLVATILVGEETATSELIEQATEVTGINSVDFLQVATEHDLKWVENKYSPIVGFILMAISATKMIHELRMSLSNIFGPAPPKTSKRSAALSLLVSRGVSLLAIIALGCCIAMSVMAESMLASVTNFLDGGSKMYAAQAIQYLSGATSYISICFLGTLALRWLPQNPPQLREAIIGSVLCSTLLFVLKFGLLVFLKNSSMSSMFGGAVTLVVLLIWIYFAMQLVLYSAEFTAVLMRDRLSEEEK